MPLPPWLADPVRFLDFYEKKAEGLASRLSVEYRVYDEFVLQAHARWATDIFARLRSDPQNEADPRFWVSALGELGLRLCRGRCITFGPPNNTPVSATLSPYQGLLLNYSDEFAAIVVVRELHMDIYYSLQPNLRQLRIEAPTFYRAPTLNELFQLLMDNPEAILKYNELLALPWLTS